METVLVSMLNLSARASHLLQRMQIDTVEEFLRVPMENFENQRGVGRKTIEELIELRTAIQGGQINIDEIGIDEPGVSFEGQDNLTLSPEILQQLSQHSIVELPLSNRSQNCLRRSGINNMAQLLELSEQELFEIHSLGRKSVEEVMELRAIWLKENCLVMKQEKGIDVPVEKKLFYEELANLLNNVFPFDSKTLYMLCLNHGIDIEVENKEMEDLTELFFEKLIKSVEELRKGIERYFSALFSKDKEFIEEEEISCRIEEDFHNDAFKTVLYDVASSGEIIKKIGDYYVLKRVSLGEYLDELELSTKNQFLIDRLEGRSLQEIGENNNLTRERVRQITVKSVKRFPLLKEDYYVSVFQYFKFNRDLFYAVFPKADRRTFEYLSIRYKKGEYGLGRDELAGYNGLYSFAIEDYINDSEKLKWKKGLTRQKISWRILITNAGRYFDKESFSKEYDVFLDNNSLDKNRYSYNPYSINNVFRNSAHVVFDRDGRFRYYENDASKLWQNIDFRRYKDTVISAELIYKDYSELMDEYDIWNGYELFCLLKNTLNVGGRSLSDIEVMFRRIPVMIIGDGDEEKQIVRLVKELSPIEYWDFYEAYEERYGLRKESAIANLGSYIEKYHTNNEYITDLPRLSYEEETRIKRVLEKKDIWSIEELENVFTEENVVSGIDALNNTTLYDMGFTLNIGYAYSRKYSNVTECLENGIFSKELVDLNEVDPEISRLSFFKNYIYTLRLSLDYIEISPKLLASKRFLEKEYGLTEEKIREIQASISSFYTEKYFNANSLWENIKEDINVKLLKGNKWLCTSIMRQQEGVFSLSVVNAVILSLQRDELALAKICTWIVEREGRMTLDRLTNRINELFGSGLDKHKIAFKIKEQGNAEELLTDGVDEYIEQLISASDEMEDDLFKEEFF